MAFNIIFSRGSLPLLLFQKKKKERKERDIQQLTNFTVFAGIVTTCEQDQSK
jgi:hypothetical protein